MAAGVVVVGGVGCAGREGPGGGGEAEDRARDDGWVALFDGATLGGWVVRGGGAWFGVEDGCIVGETRPNEPNTFLCTEAEYGDFELELEFRVDAGLNSGVQVRSRWDPHPSGEATRGRVRGYQVEIDPSSRAWTGGIYDEGGRGWLQGMQGNEAARGAFRSGAWNRLRVVAEGPRLRTWVNGVAAADLVDGVSGSGLIGLQVHGVGAKTEPMRVRWRSIRVRILRGG